MESKQHVQDQEIATISVKDIDYLCLTDIARYKNPAQADLIVNDWLSDKNTVEFLGLWEQLNNPAFNVAEFDGLLKRAGLNGFTPTSKHWIEATAAVGLVVSSGPKGFTFGQPDIACEFACWLSVEFKFYFIKELQRTNREECRQIGQDIKRNLGGIEKAKIGSGM